MHLVQILLPKQTGLDHNGLQEVRDELTQQFGGVTAYLQSPAEGLWKDQSQQTTRDDVVLVEVMVDDLDRAWWSQYREELEARFQQEQIVIRSQAIELL